MQEKSLVLVGSPDLEPDQVEMAEDAKLNTCVIYNEQGCIYRAIFEDFLSRKRIKPANAIELWSIEAIKRCVISGLGIRRPVASPADKRTLKTTYRSRRLPYAPPPFPFS